jgi:4'-phosphopantetheinyl transferase EntD
MSDPTAPPSGLWPDEVLGTVMPKRLSEFAAGRRAARSALAHLGQPACAIPVSPDRSPLWPEGYIGSISHSDRACVAITSKKSQWSGLGVDLEPAIPLDAPLWSTVLVEEDYAHCANPLHATAIFSIKEAVYKAQYAITKQLFGFDVLTVSLASDHFHVRFLEQQGCFPKGHELEGHWGIASGHVIALAAIAP